MGWWSCSVGVTLILCVAGCSAADADLPWWKTAVFYQVYPRSFMDSDGDGVGDLKGITQAADYFTTLGVDAIWLSPINTSPMADFGYDISNYTAIDPIFGTMDDFDELLAKLQNISVKLVLDFVPNHSSDEHPWFQASVNNETDYTDFYVWKDALEVVNGTPVAPNNWISVFSGSAWEWSDTRGQFYLHKFVVKQPDLNYRNDYVIGNMTAVINFWLDKGVDGFRMDAVQQIYENASFPDESAVAGTAGDTYDTQMHDYEMNQPETYTLLQYWAEVVYERVLADGKERAIFLEVYDTINTTMKFYGTGNESLEFPFNFNLLTQGNESTRPAEIKTIIDEWMDNMPSDGVANWVVGNHDNERVADRYGAELVDAINLLTGVLPGIKVVYNGEEIGMQDTFIRWDQTVDPDGLLAGEYAYTSSSRDPERTPMQWDNTTSAGFSTNSSTWLPVNPNYWWLNVEAQLAAETSHLKVFAAMAQARKDTVLQRGDYEVLVPDDDTLVVVRSYNASYYVLVVNFGSNILTYTSASLFSPQNLDMDMTVVTGSVQTGYSVGTNFYQGSISFSLRPKAAILLKSGTTASTDNSTDTSSWASGTKYSGVTLLACVLLVILHKP